MEVETFPLMQEFNDDASLPGFQPGKLGTLGGMIAHLTGVHGGNVHEKGAVVITASSTLSTVFGRMFGRISRDQPKNVADHESNSFFASKNEPNQWICFDFVARMVRLTAYAIRSYPGGPGHPHPKSWVIEVSSDGASWREIDRRDDNQDLNGGYLTKVFTVARAPECRMIRLTQTGKNHQGDDDYERLIRSAGERLSFWSRDFGNDRLLFSDFEVFGDLAE